LARNLLGAAGVYREAKEDYVRHALTLIAATALTAAGLAQPVEAEATRTLKLQHTDVAHPFGVENLAGTMRVLAGSGPTVEVAVTVHAESQDLADAMRFETVQDKGMPTLRVRYPFDRTTHFQYPGGGAHRANFKYDGREVSVSATSGTLLYADVEVRLPAGRLEASLRNGVGSLKADGVEGALKFDTGSGNITLAGVGGDVLADTGSGDVKAERISGVFRCDTGSGDCDVTDFAGDSLSLDTGSGALRVRGVKARKLNADSGSGQILVSEAEVEEVKADSGSGNVEIEAAGSKLARVKADTGSGDVRLRLGTDASFEAHADIGSGDIVSHYQDAEPILRKREVVGYRRGDGRTRIDVNTGSGDLVLEPGR
jgi:hypothetical protein